MHTTRLKGQERLHAMLMQDLYVLHARVEQSGSLELEGSTIADSMPNVATFPRPMISCDS